MDQMNEKELARAMSWVRAQVEKETFGEVGFTLTVHQGAIRRIAYQLVEKKATPPNPRAKRQPGVPPTVRESVPARKHSSKRRLIKYEELSEVLGVHRVTQDFRLIVEKP